ncbi:NAD(P)/FAD-dependent oxidoreductase [Allorhizobium sonneratiae]|uniref:NAD(P)/FAD-dependent oxidoreductase n=1 Tax=Allorhizobium sonneratiae TaxID=2934936 RepID=UPI00237D233C|nr:FAD-dependent oxidoreductase [Allorhizobium sonneratiae]
MGPVGTGRKQRVAVIGSGISGLSAAWLLSKSVDVVLYEAENRPGGHSNTVTVQGPEGSVAVDTGFIVYNGLNYPNLVALFDHLGVETQASDMSFAASLDGGGFEYCGSRLSGLLGQKINMVRPRFWRMMSDIIRFYKAAPALLEREDLREASLGDYLAMSRYSHAFIEDHLLPMGAAIWSTTAKDMRAYPLHAFLRFFVNHGLVQIKDRPHWRTVKGGSQTYVRRLLETMAAKVHLGDPVVSVLRNDAGATVTTRSGHQDHFDAVTMATHADQALALLGDADPLEQKLLGAFDYTTNRAVLHSDATLMPKRRTVWASWNYIGDIAAGGATPLCVTYWMNRLQSLPASLPLFVTLNPSREIAPSKVHASFDYTHPLFDAKALAAQRQLWQLQGRRHSWFCGAYFGSGFHEDGLQSGLAVAEDIGGLRRPWTVANESGRIHLKPTLMAAE